MRRTTTMLITIGSFLATATVSAQELHTQKAPFEFIKNGSVLTVKSASGKALATIDLDRPEIRGKVIAFTYSAKKKTNIEGVANSVGIYPNPASKQVNLELKGTWKYPVQVRIFDKTGNVLQRETLESSEQPLDVGSLNQGVYILKAQSGNATAVEKLVVQ